MSVTIRFCAIINVQLIFAEFYLSSLINVTQPSESV